MEAREATDHIHHNHNRWKATTVVTTQAIAALKNPLVRCRSVTESGIIVAVAAAATAAATAAAAVCHLPSNF